VREEEKRTPRSLSFLSSSSPPPLPSTHLKCRKTTGPKKSLFSLL